MMPTSELDGLEFPVAAGFISTLPSGTLEDVYRACEAMLPTALAQPGELKRRRSEDFAAEFVL
jgi:hypothetical protein